MKYFIKSNFPPIYHFVIYIRYLINRYFVKRRISSYAICKIDQFGNKNLKLDPVDSGICFFGYYNLTPSNSNNDVLFLKVQQENIRGSFLEPASIMLRKRSGQVAKLGQTRTWNWQQGCMLQWYPGKDNHILFNDYDQEQDKYISKVINRSGQLKKTYPIPVNSVSRCGKFALSLNYDRLARMRPDYGYFNKKNNDLPVDDHEDGIWYLDLSSRQTKLLITLEQLKSLSYSTTMENATHKVNHIDINPGGTRFMFLHRWIGPQGRFMRLITANQDGSGLFILNGDIMTSHCCWLSDKEILSFCEYNGKRGYFKFEDQTKKAILISEKFPIVDGHPSISPDSKWIITDTYPDKARFSSLYLYNFQDDIILELGRFFQPLQYKGEKRTDLHPKWSNFSEKIYFESSHTGKRTFYEFKLNEML